MLKKIKLSIGMILGALIGLLFTPKKGKEVRDYLGSEDFKEKVVEAGMKVEGLKDEAQEKSKTLVSRVKSVVANCKKHCKKRFGK